jgi:hypothetical protein
MHTGAAEAIRPLLHGTTAIATITSKTLARLRQEKLVGAVT